MSYPPEPATSTTPAAQFQALWLQGGIPDLASFLESQSKLSNAELVAILRIDQAEHWRALDRQHSEAYLARFPAIANESEAALDLIYAEYLLRKKFGPPPTIAEFVARFPRHAAQLRPQLQLDALAESAAQSSGEHVDEFATQETLSILSAGINSETCDHLAATDVFPMPAGGRESSLPPTSRVNGRIVGNYQLVRELGRGGMGTVWEAEMLGTGRRVALKMVNRPISRDSEEATQFLREAQLAASISHPRSAFVLEAGWHEGQPFLVMELMPGKTLRSVVVEGDITVTQAIDYVLDVLEGVVAAHERGVIHRDIKPANCFLDGEGRATIGDYGLALPLLADPLEGRFAGTPAFASPEQIRVAKLNERSDQYSLGATLYFLLARRPPFVGEFTSLIAQVAADPPPPLKNFVLSLPNGLERIIRRTLEKDPAGRYSNLAQLRQALLPFSSSGTFLANIGRRLAAYAIDDALLIAAGLLTLIAVVIGSLTVNRWRGDFASDAAVGRLGSLVAFYVLLCGYFTLAEGWYGGGLGKWLVGLRVVGPDGGPPGLARSALRTLFVPLTCGCVFLDALILPLQPLTAESVENFDLYKLLLVPGLLGAASNLVLLAILAPALFREDFRGLHDLASGTRVMALQTPEVRPSAIVTNETKIEGASASGRTYGPYQQLTVRHESPEFTLYEATDDVLRRRVRIVVRPAGPTPSYNRVNLSRPTRNRWLQGATTGELRWDAFETTSGGTLWKALRDGPLPWETQRAVLLDLAEEVNAATTEGTLPEQVSLGHLYLTTSGHLQLFDWPLVLDPAAPTFQGKSRGWQLFQHVVKTSGIASDWPLHARNFCEQAQPIPLLLYDPHAPARTLRDMAQRPATFRWDDRLGLMSLAIIAQGWLFALLMLMAGGAIARMPGVDSAVRFALLGLICVSLPGLTTLLFGRSLLLRFLNIHIRRADGSAAGRLRMFVRTVFAWLPWTLAAWLFAWTVGAMAAVFASNGPDPRDFFSLMRPTFVLICFLGGFLPLAFLFPSGWFALQSPTRSLAERLSGTRLVYD